MVVLRAMQQAVQDLCPAFPPGIGIMVLVEAGSPGKSSPAGLRSRADSCPAVPDGVLLPEL